MTQTVIMKWQKNELFKLIQSAGMNPYEFELKEFIPDELLEEDPFEVKHITNVIHRESEFEFSINAHETNSFFVRFSPSQVYPSELNDSYHLTWFGVIELFKNWIDMLSKEVNQPDLWEELSKYTLSESEVSSNTSNEPFSVAQQTQIETGLDKIYAYLKDQGIKSAEQDKFVKDSLNYLKESAKRFGRKDWINMCIGSLVTIATSLALQPEQANTMWQIIKSAISGIIHFLP